MPRLVSASVKPFVDVDTAIEAFKVDPGYFVAMLVAARRIAERLNESGDSD